MRIATFVLLVAAIAVRAEITFCPRHCSCTTEGTSGVTVVCTRLNLEDQEFTYPVQHLTVIPDHTPIQLTDDIFARLGLKHLESLKIVHSPLADISVRAFYGLPALNDINLSNNQLFLIHADTFANNTNLKHLKLSGNPMQLMQVLETPTPYLLRSASLSELDLSNCSLAQILPKTFSELRNLIFVNLSSNFLKTIPKDLFEGLEYLEDIDLSSNQLRKLEKDTFKQNKGLSVLRLAHNSIESLNGLNLPLLDELDLSSCRLHILMKESLEGMPHLTLLNLSSNQMEVISDDSFVIFPELKKLDLSYNKLVGPLAKDLFEKNRDLEELSLSGNRELGSFVEEPGFVGQHIAMKTLEIADCGLSQISAGQFQGMENLNVLNVSRNQIVDIDESTFKNLKRLNTLDLSYNRMQTLGVHVFAKNTELVRLKLIGNPLKHLPLVTFRNTPSLTFLEVDPQLRQSWNLDEFAKTLPQVASLGIPPSKKFEASANEKFLRKIITAPAAVLQNQQPSYTSVDEIVVNENRTIMWPMILAMSILIVALYCIIYLVGEITHRRRTVTSSPLGGHIRSRDASGAPLYYKLYEECSVPKQPIKKKGYKIMRNNNEANV